MSFKKPSLTGVRIVYLPAEDFEFGEKSWPFKNKVCCPFIVVSEHCLFGVWCVELEVFEVLSFSVRRQKVLVHN